MNTMHVCINWKNANIWPHVRFTEPSPNSIILFPCWSTMCFPNRPSPPNPKDSNWLQERFPLKYVMHTKPNTNHIHQWFSFLFDSYIAYIFFHRLFYDIKSYYFNFFKSYVMYTKPTNNHNHQWFSFLLIHVNLIFLVIP